MDEPVWSLGGADGAVLVVRVPPELTHATADGVRACVERRLPNRDGVGVVLDMADVELISSMGVTALLQIEELVTGAGGVLCLGGLSDRARGFLAMLRLADRFAQAVDVGEAIARVGDG